jgi:hypothetical protein
MSVLRLRARIDRLEAALLRHSRMAELISKFKTGDLTADEDKEALSLDRRWPAIKASIVADWDLQFRKQERQKRHEQIKQSTAPA